MSYQKRFTEVRPVRPGGGGDPRLSLSFDEALGITYGALKEFPEARAALEKAFIAWLEAERRRVVAYDDYDDIAA